MRRTFSRFKYAEEFAHEADNDGKEWLMGRMADTVNEDGYTEPVYVVDIKDEEDHG